MVRESGKDWLLDQMGLGDSHEFVFEHTDVQDVTGIDKAAMERISLLRDAPWKGNAVSSQKDPLGNYHLPGVAKPETEIPPITEFADGTPLRSLPLHAFERQSWFPDVEYGFLPEDTEWLSLAKAEIPKAVKEYIKVIETGETTKWCKCPWAVHPDHVNIPENHCVACGEPKDDQCHVDGAIVLAEEAAKGWHHFRGRGIRRMDTHEMCPVHTKEGLVLGLFEYLFKEEDETPSDSGG